MTIALLATGDEIIHGDVLNTDSHDLAHALHSEGLPLGLQVACSDIENDIHECLSFLASTHDIIILIGGLGPTSDDRTRFALKRFLKTELIEFPEAMQHIQNRLRLYDRELTPGNKQQALFPSGATLLPNPNGTAMGCYYKLDEKIFILLPGPPRECLPMFNNHVLPLLQNVQPRDKTIYKWRLFGVAEGQIAHELDAALADIDCETGYRLDVPYVEFKVRCKEHLISKVKQRIEPLIAPHLIATVEKKASEQLQEKILQLKQPISIIDEATGGLLQTIIQTPNNFSLLKFNNCDNDAVLRFHLQGLKEYWSQEPPMGKTTLSIAYNMDDKKGTEVHEIPYRSAYVIHLAAEWLSFRLFHLINQLHQ
ncbi:Competence damage inducible protein CinA [Legionella lansingensis]|uniref:Competence damage inducible protein CinA n=1 Tax=Legionella lansingensis TaxID=45067 RepID=A0A0W0VUV0_9GAMM|nr:competence/damage-inducible protein A [Legionella lansingensis]KTD23806.1 competence damage inducible protein CinA [Legionella lansingensis]SNV46935.1 Competence damage inducible protein CinA [Legionella lansingensis]